MLRGRSTDEKISIQVKIGALGCAALYGATHAISAHWDILGLFLLCAGATYAVCFVILGLVMIGSLNRRH